MSEIRELSEHDRKILKHDFPNHTVDGFSKKTPDWVIEICKNARRELVEAGLLLPYACTETVGLGTGPAFRLIRDGTLIHSSADDGVGQIALLLGQHRAWVIASWNAKTGEALPLPTMGCPVQMPDEGKGEEIMLIRQEALRHAKKELERMQREFRQQFVIALCIGIIVFTVLWIGKSF